MKKIVTTIVLLVCVFSVKAQIDEYSVFGMPTATTAQIQAVTPLAEGALVYSTDEDVIYRYTSSEGWVRVGNQNASQVSITDAGGNFTADNVEDALAELAANSENLATNNLTQAAESRSYNMNGQDLGFTNGSFGVGTASPSGTMEGRSTSNTDAFLFVQQDGTTGEKDVFTIEDQDTGGGGQDESSVLKIVKSGPINTGDNGFSLIELANTNTDPGANKYWISGRKTDEGAPQWGVDITDNDFWSEGGILLGATGADGGTYSGGNFIVESDGDTGVGTTSPDARLDVEGGNVRFSDYGGNAVTGNGTSLIAVEADGDLVEVNSLKASRVFYPPSIAIDASSPDPGADRTINLYDQYIAQFGTPVASSAGTIPTYAANELDYHVTYADPSVFGNGTTVQNMSVSATGVLTYRIYNTPADYNALINVVFVVK